MLFIYTDGAATIDGAANLSHVTTEMHPHFGVPIKKFKQLSSRWSILSVYCNVANASCRVKKLTVRQDAIMMIKVMIVWFLYFIILPTTNEQMSQALTCS